MLQKDGIRDMLKQRIEKNSDQEFRNILNNALMMHGKKDMKPSEIEEKDKVRNNNQYLQYLLNLIGYERKDAGQVLSEHISKKSTKSKIMKTKNGK